MKRFIITAILVALTICAWSVITPKAFVQKVTLSNGKLPFLTCDDKTSAQEYILTADVLEIPGDVVSTETNPTHTVVFKYVGDNIQLQKMAVISVQLGNFQNQWEAGQTLHLELTHKATKKKVSWNIPITEGSTLMNYVKKPIKLPKAIKK